MITPGTIPLSQLNTGVRHGIARLLLIIVFQLSGCANTIHIDTPLPVARSPELPKRWDINADIKLPATKRIVIDRDDNNEVQSDSFRGQMTLLPSLFIESSVFDRFVLGFAAPGRVTIARQFTGKSSENAQAGNYSSAISLELVRYGIENNSLEDVTNNSILMTYSLGKRINSKLLVYGGLGAGYHDISFTNQPFSQPPSDRIPASYSHPGNSQTLTFALQYGRRYQLNPHLVLARNDWKGVKTEYDVGLGLDLVHHF